MTRIRNLTGALLLAFSLAAFAAAPARAEEEKVLNVYNWSDYVAPDTLAEFTRRTGIKVNYDVYDSNDVLEAKLLVGKSGYDVVFPSSMPYLARQAKAGVYQKLDFTKLPHAKGLDSKVMTQLKTADPQNAYAVPYMMAGTGVGYIRSKIDPLLPTAPLGSLAMLFDPKVVGALKPCGVTLLDTPDEIFPAALSYIGHDPLSTSEADLKAAGEVIGKARPGYRYFHSSSYINDLANGAICVAQGYAGDLFQARKRAAEAKNGVEIGIFLPKEGAAFNIDVMAIPKDAPHPGNAHKFIDYILEPQVVAKITNAVGYANAVPASREFIDKDIESDPVVYPPADIRLYSAPLVSAKYERERNRLWTRIKTGR
ncbi:MAG TPA: polyamine ABC transporter substrate-binding protein [Pseudolabrys sp.]|jgi:putrescine transport system substrate-binding protein|nr:polyamine ABC transporter substrate-binding protein [Pseudolabrys sp.]